MRKRENVWERYAGNSHMQVATGKVASEKPRGASLLSRSKFFLLVLLIAGNAILDCQADWNCLYDGYSIVPSSWDSSCFRVLSVKDVKRTGGTSLFGNPGGVGGSTSYEDVEITRSPGTGKYAPYPGIPYCMSRVNDYWSVDYSGTVHDACWHVSRVCDVVSIAPNAFADCEKTSQRTLIISHSVTNIGSNAFGGAGDCHGYELVYVSAAVRSVGKNAFSRCRPEHIVTPASYVVTNAFCESPVMVTINGLGADESICDYAFSGCDKLQTIGFTNMTADAIASIGDGAFKSCRALQRIDGMIQGGSFSPHAALREIGNEAFNGCRAIQEVTIPDSVEKIGGNAFDDTEFWTRNGRGLVIQDGWLLGFNCDGAASPREIYIPAEVRHIADNAFANCHATEYIYFHPNIESIGKNAFVGTRFWSDFPLGLVVYNGWLLGYKWNHNYSYDIDIPSDVGHIADGVFEKMYGIKSVNVHSNVLSIGAFAFRGCRDLNHFSYYPDVTRIGYRVFEGCTSLSEIDENDVAAGVSSWDYVVTFDANGGAVSADQYYVSSGAEIGQLPEATHPGAYFVGWYTSPNGGDRVLQAQTITQDVMYYAHWAPHPLVVTFDLGSHEFERVGGGELVQMVAYGDSVVPPDIAGRGAECFGGWDGDIAQPILENVTFVARAGVETYASGSYLGCSWTFRERDGILQISGDMIEKSSVLYANEWKSIKTKVKRIEIAEGVTAIGYYAFQNFTALESVALPTSLTNIGPSAFSGCVRLKEVEIGDGVVSIGSCAFMNCKKLVAVHIPGSVQKVQDKAFEGCLELKKVEVKGDIPILGNRIFAKCESLQDIALGAKFRRLTQGMFSGCESLRRIVLPSTITNVHQYAFEGCTDLDLIFEGDAPALTITSSSTNAINADCQAYVRTESAGWNVTIPGVWSGIPIAYGGNYKIQFDLCGHGDDLLILRTFGAELGELPSVSCYGYEFEGWFTDAGEMVAASTMVCHDCKYYARWLPLQHTVSFDSNGGSECHDINVCMDTPIEDWPTPTLRHYIFGGWCTDQGCLVDMDRPITESQTYFAKWIPEQHTVVFDANGGMGGGSRAQPYGSLIGFFPDDPILAGHTFIGWFSEPVGGRKIEVTESIYGDVTYYARWTVIHYAVSFDSQGGTLYDSILYAYGESLGGLPLPWRDGYAFAGWYTDLIGGSPITEDTIVERRTTYYAHWIQGVPISDAEFDGIEYTWRMNEKSEAILTGVASNVTKRTQDITLPATITYYIYDGDGNVESYLIPVCGIDDYAFRDDYVSKTNSRYWTSVVIPDGVREIGRQAFYSLTWLQSVTLPDSLETIGDSAFANCVGLTNMPLPEGVRAIGKEAFRRTRLSFPDLPSGLMDIGEKAFYGTGLRSATVPSGVDTISHYAFQSCSVLTNCVVSEGVKAINFGAFSMCDTLYSVAIAASVTNIESGAFADCDGLRRIVVSPDNMAYKAESGFLLSKDGKTLVAVPGGLVGVSVPNCVTKIGMYALRSNERVMNITMHDGVTNIGQVAFSYCHCLKSVVIPSSVDDIGASAFYHCTNLTTITFNGNEPNAIGSYAFDGVKNGCVARVPKTAKGYAVDESGKWKGLVVERYVSIPNIAADATRTVVIETVENIEFADNVVTMVIGGSAEEYNAFKTWADGVKGVTGDALAGEAAVVANEHAAAAYLLGAERLFENEPTVEIGELAIAESEGAGTTAMTVAVTVKDGESAVAVDAEKVAAMFEATGDLGDWNGAAKLTPTVTTSGTDASGKMTFVVTPGDGTASKAFLRIKR